MTLAEFFALTTSPQAIIVPRRGLRAGSTRHASVGAAGADAKSTISAATPDEGSAGKKH